MAQENGNIETIVEQIVCTSLLGDIEYQNTEDKAKRKYLYDQQTEMVNESIDQMCKLIEAKLPNDVSLPIGLRVEVANQMLVEVMQNPTAVATGFKLDEKSVMRTMNLPIKDEERDDEDKYISQDAKSEQTAEEAELRKAVEQFNEEKETMQKNLLEKAWGQEGTEEDKKAVVASTELDVIEQMMTYNIGFNELDFDEKGFIVASLRLLKEQGKLEKLEILKEKLGITDEIIESEEYDGFEFEVSAQNKEEDELDIKIRHDAEVIKFYIKHGNINPERNDERYEDIERRLSSADCPIDSLLYALQNERTKDNPRFNQILTLLNAKLKDSETELEFDQYVIMNAVSIAGELMKRDPEKANELLNNINARLREQNMEELSIDSIKELANMPDKVRWI